jgi:hypothetical protein
MSELLLVLLFISILSHSDSSRRGGCGTNTPPKYEEDMQRPHSIISRMKGGE